MPLHPEVIRAAGSAARTNAPFSDDLNMKHLFRSSTAREDRFLSSVPKRDRLRLRFAPGLANAQKMMVRELERFDEWLCASGG
jgi:hypothetical protein